MKPQIITIQILLTLLFICVKQIQAQELSTEELKQVNFSKPISFVRGENNEFYLVFCNSQTRSIQSKYDIRANSPFKSIGKKTDNPYYDIYDLGNKMFSEVFPNFDFEPYYHKDQLSDTIQVNQVRVHYDVGFSNNMKYATASYTMITGYDLYRTLFVVFDSTGVEVNRFVADTGTDQINITNNGKYLVFSFGGKSNEGGMFMSGGIIIMDIIKGEVLVRKDIDNIAGVFTSNNLIIAGTHNYYNLEKKEVKKRLFFDIENQKVYSRELDVDCIGKAIINDEGIIMNCLNGTSYLLTFRDDFKVEDLR